MKHTQVLCFLSSHGCGVAHFIESEPSTSFPFETEFSLIIVNTMAINLILSNCVITENYIYFEFL